MTETPSLPQPQAPAARRPAALALLLPYALLAATMAAFSVDAPARLRSNMRVARQHSVRAAKPRALFAVSVDYPVPTSRVPVRLAFAR